MLKSSKFIKWALGVRYDGSKYYGWQKQKALHTIQEYLENALSVVANHEVKVFCAGRTDAGVHSIGQVVHFETISKRNESAWTRGVNAHLPHDIAVSWVKEVPNCFHARFSALARRYLYIIYNKSLRCPLFNNCMMHFYPYLSEEKMYRAGQYLLGENDFSTFRSSYCQSHTPWRKLIYLKVKRYGHYITIDMKANSFVHHMVRNIVGSLIEVGCGKHTEKWISELLIAKDRKLAGVKAQAQGLYLLSVDYPSHFALPYSNNIEPLFLIN
ncbi:tRNA pseudouridine(38-40) synthase TruA [Candidatus Ishikawella capsulata]|uniref:tRNA pseudouridine synthase A n=1 Tax=Candidatus Ishikawaella capsulata Mpkobe TaxID=476281 RepID=C5WCA7_9ENTR|nr:tRNA pseudouridine(38-40) synthase TruA [Candidatus Ishikawaella capsulata]BAH82963.1 tRNA pseudouridine synthase A [Candidatus Ishikawaella capsulata Mpkobe]